MLFSLIFRDIIIDLLRYILLFFNVDFMHTSSYLAKVKTYVLPYSMCFLLISTDYLPLPFQVIKEVQMYLYYIGLISMYWCIAVSYYTLYTFLLTIKSKGKKDDKKSS